MDVVGVPYCGWNCCTCSIFPMLVPSELVRYPSRFGYGYNCCAAGTAGAIMEGFRPKVASSLISIYQKNAASVTMTGFALK